MSTLKWETAKVFNAHLLDEFRLDDAFSLLKISNLDGFHFNHLAGVIPTLNEFIDKCLNEDIENFGIKDYRVRSIVKYTFIILIILIRNIKIFRQLIKL